MSSSMMGMTLYERTMGRLRLRVHEMAPIEVGCRCLAELQTTSERGEAASSMLTIEEMRDLRYLLDRAIATVEMLHAVNNLPGFPR